MEVSTAIPTNVSGQYSPGPEWLDTYEVFEGVFFSVVHAGAILSNGFTLLVMVCARRLHTSSNMVLGSLALADMFVALEITIDKYVNGVRQRTYGSWVADTVVNTALLQLPLLVTHFHTVVIAMERYIAICRPLRYSSIWTASRVRWVLAGTWGMSVLLCSTVVAWGAIWESPRNNRMPTVHSLLSAIIAYCLTAIVVTAIYARILTVARQQHAKIRNIQLQVINATRCSDTPTGMPSKPKWSRGSRLLTATIVAVFLCWGPFLAVTLAIHFMEHVQPWHYAMQGMMLSFAFTHYIFNLAIYMWNSRDFRKVCKLMLLCHFRELRMD